MNSKTAKLLKIFALFILSFCASILGLGLSYHSYITPISSKGEFHKISGDKWLQDGASIKLRNIASRSNQLLISFNPWRPIEPAEIDVSLCGTIVSHLTIKDNSVHTIYLSESCEPRTISFDVRNPYTPSVKDNRKLGAQLNYVKVTSRLGIPIVKLTLIALTTLAIFLLSLLTLYALNSSLWISTLVPVASVLLLNASRNLELTQPFSLWLFLSALLLGVILVKKSNLIEDVKTNPKSFLAFLIFILAVALRFYGLNFGLPANFHPDEVPKFNAIQRMLSHEDLNPRYFLHPTLLLYSTYFSNFIYQSIANSPDWSSTLIFAGRIVSATAGSLSVFLVFLIGRTLFNTHIGLIGSLILSVAPLHVTCSRYVKEDSLLTFFILLSVYLLVKATKEDKKSLLYLSGFAAGAAASTKYSGILTGAILLTAPWLRSYFLSHFPSSKSFTPDKKYLIPTIIACLFVPIGLFACSPYIILDYQTFLSDFASERDHMIRGHMVTIDAWSQFWMFHFYRSILPGMTFISALLATAGIGVLIYRRKISDLFLLSVILLFYLPAEFVKAKPAPQPERYILPCLPFLALAGGVFLYELKKYSSAIYSFTYSFILTIAVVFSLHRSITLAFEIKNDTRDQMHAWMIENIPKGASILVDWKPYNPPFKEGEFNIIYLPREDIISKLRVSEIKKSGADYILLSSLYFSRYFDQPNSDPAFRDVFRKVFKTFQKTKEITPRYGTYGFHNPKLLLFDLKKKKGLTKKAT